MKTKLTTSAVLLILPVMFIALVACGSNDGVATQTGDVIGETGSVVVANEAHSDEDAHAAGVVDEHDDVEVQADAIAVSDGSDARAMS